MAKQEVTAVGESVPEWMVSVRDAIGSVDLSDVYRSEDYGGTTITLDAADQNELLAFEDALERAGLTEADAIIGSAYVQADKSELVGVPFLIVTCAISRDKVTEREYIIARILTRENPSRQLVITDGGTGFFEQMKAHIRERLNSGQPAWEGYYIKGGLRVSEFNVVKDPKTNLSRPQTAADIAAGVKVDSQARTYYIA